ncbi:protein GRAVITROPIC IN THE LIGHT 1 [Silene latifolia]|uniref:protein GRAVITROPIC IN THE LIGHT 1 n=1 Tax=Silene latifolia TaxID=37657 RepID=UPI003D784BA2
MLDMDGSIKPPQISEMFQKFALSFRSKAFEFFSDEINNNNQKIDLIDCDEQDEEKMEIDDQSSLIDEKGKVIKNAQFNETLIISLFASISSFEASYLHLQTAHVPNFDQEAVNDADKSLISHLQTLSEFKQLYKNYYQNPNFNVEFSSGSCLEFQVNENQHKLRALKSVFNRLQADIDVKCEEVSGLRKEWEELSKVNSRLSKRLSFCCSKEEEKEEEKGCIEVLLTVRVFDRMLREAFSFSHKFTKVLVGLMKRAGWDLELAANSVYSGVDYVKKGHSRYALLSYVCLRMFQGFDLEGFGVGEVGSVCNGDISTLDSEEKRVSSLRQLKDHVSTNPMEMLRECPNCEFSRFCERKYQELIHPTMESSIFNELDQGEVVNSWKSLGVFYELFVKMASAVWALHKLAFCFDPHVGIFQVERGVDFSMVYMEDVTRRCTFPCKSRPKVGFTVVPGFKIGQTIIQSQVYLTGIN